MNRRVLPLIIGVLLSLGCGGTSSPPSPPGPNGDDDRTSPTDADPLPEWLVTLTEQLESQPVANPPAYIARREYAAGVYYYLPPRCCDIPSSLFDSEGISGFLHFAIMYLKLSLKTALFFTIHLGYQSFQHRSFRSMCFNPEYPVSCLA